MDRIHFEIGDVAGIHAACCIWINGRALTQIVDDEWGDGPARSLYRHRFLPIRSVQPVPDYWLGCAARQADRWVLLLHEPIEETGDSSWIATQVTVGEKVIRWSAFISKVGLHAGRGEVWPHPGNGPFLFARSHYDAALRRLARQVRALRCAERWHDTQV